MDGDQRTTSAARRHPPGARPTHRGLGPPIGGSAHPSGGRPTHRGARHHPRLLGITPGCSAPPPAAPASTFTRARPRWERCDTGSARASATRWRLAITELIVRRTGDGGGPPVIVRHRKRGTGPGASRSPPEPWMSHDHRPPEPACLTITELIVRRTGDGGGPPVIVRHRQRGTGPGASRSPPEPWMSHDHRPPGPRMSHDHQGSGPRAEADESRRTVSGGRARRSVVETQARTRRTSALPRFPLIRIA